MKDLILILVYGVISLLYIFLIPKMKKGSKVAERIIRVVPYIWIFVSAWRILDLMVG